MSEIETALLDLIDDSEHHVIGQTIQIKFTAQYAYIKGTGFETPICVNREALVNTVKCLNDKMEEGKKLDNPIYIIKEGIHTTYLKPPVCPVCTRAHFKPYPIESENRLMLACPNCQYKETYDTWTPTPKGCETCD